MTLQAVLDFIALKGYGLYVWPAYALVLGSLAVQLLLPWQRLRKIQKKKAL